MDVSSLFALWHSPLLLLLVTLLVPAIFSLLIVVSTKKDRHPPSCSNGGQLLPPSPPGLPILGHLHLLGSLPHRNLRSLAEAHGPVMLLRLGRVPTVVASSAAAAQEVMKTRDLAFASRPQMRMAQKLLYGRDMVLAPYGEYWRQARRVCVVHLLSTRRILSFRRVREQEVAALIGLVHHRSQAQGSVVNLADTITSYSNAVIIRAAFGDGDYGIDGDDGGEKLRKVLDDFEHLLGTATVGEFVPWLAWLDTLTGLNAKATRTFQALDELLVRVIAGHRQRRLSGWHLVDDGEDDQRDFVDVLLDVNETGEEAGGVLFDEVRIKAIMLSVHEGPWRREVDRCRRDARSMTPERSRRRSRGRSRAWRDGNEIVVHERTVQERIVTGGNTVWPMLTATNYVEWALVMQINLEANLMWEAVEGNPSSVAADKAAHAALLRSVPPEMVGALAIKSTAKAAWDAVKVMRVGVDRVKEATAQRLRKEFEDLAFKDGEGLDAFSLRIMSIVNNLHSLGDTVEDLKVVQKILRIVPDHYAQMACSIETLLDLSTISMEELIGRLRSSEGRGGGVTSAQGAGGALLLTEEEWEARRRQCEQGQGSGGGNGGGRKKGKPKPKHGGGRNGNGGNANTGERDMFEDMFAAATDTTYSIMERAMAELMNHPSKMRKLQDKIRAAVNGASRVTEDHLEQLHYLRAVIKETLRLHAPLTLLLPRETVEDTELLGYHLPARTRVVINAWAIGRDPATWERADEFVPERFGDGQVEYVPGQDFSFVPFGAGRRGCPGVGFATPSMELALASLLYHFDWELPNGASKVDMSEQFGISMRLKVPLHLVAKPWST